MKTFIASLIIFAIAIFMMSIGYLFARKKLEKNCGMEKNGVPGLGCKCKAEGKDPNACWD